MNEGHLLRTARVSRAHTAGRSAAHRLTTARFLSQTLHFAWAAASPRTSAGLPSPFADERVI